LSKPASLFRVEATQQPRILNKEEEANGLALVVPVSFNRFF
jgi:hypothetical protein